MCLVFFQIFSTLAALTGRRNMYRNNSTVDIHRWTRDVGGASERWQADWGCDEDSAEGEVGLLACRIPSKNLSPLSSRCAHRKSSMFLARRSLFSWLVRPLGLVWSISSLLCGTSSPCYTCTEQKLTVKITRFIFFYRFFSASLLATSSYLINIEGGFVFR